jgi:hypothetical protein
MEMLEIHQAALASGNIPYHEFLLCYKSGNKIVYGIVEGRQDPCFYRGLIESILPNGWEVRLIKAGSKKKVQRVFVDIDWTRFAKKRVCFFVDRDLSDFLGGEKHFGENLYVTDKYSIDSEIVNPKTFERTLEEVYGVADMTPAESDAIRKLFDENLSSFSEEMCSVMAQIILWRRAGADVCLDNIEPKDFFTFNAGRIELKPAYKAAHSRIQHAANAVKTPQSNANDIGTMEAEFRAKNGASRFIRGKYLLWFFVQMLTEVHKIAPAFCAKHKAPPKAVSNIGVSNAMAIVAPRARCPDSLRQFIEQNYLEYIRILGAYPHPIAKS